MTPGNDRGRPGEERPRNVTAGNTSSLLELARKAERARRDRLILDLCRLADKIEDYDRPAADLARYFAAVSR